MLEAPNLIESAEGLSGRSPDLAVVAGERLEIPANSLGPDAPNGTTALGSEIDTAEVGITPPVPPVTFRTPAISVSVTCQPDARGSVSPGTGSAYCLSPEGVNATPLAMWVVGCAVSAGLTQTSSTSLRLPRWSVAQDALANALGLIANPEYGDTDVRLDVR